MAAATCYGLKPEPGTANVLPFSSKSWNDPSSDMLKTIRNAISTGMFIVLFVL